MAFAGDSTTTTFIEKPFEQWIKRVSCRKCSVSGQGHDFENRNFALSRNSRFTRLPPSMNGNIAVFDMRIEPETMAVFPHRHLLGIEGLSPRDIEILL
ncbi:MAG: hypothetical protein ACKPE2_02320, partial [Dolichospermum sp.]